MTANGSPWTQNRGGGTLAVHSLAEALTALGHEVTVLYGRRPGDPPAPPLPYKTRWAHFYKLATLNLNIFSFRKVLAELIQKDAFDIVHGNAEESLFAPALCRRAGIPFCYTSHANYLPTVGLFQGMLRPIRFLKSVNAFLERATALQANQIFTFSHFSKGLVTNALGPDSDRRIRIISPGIDSKWLTPPPPGIRKQQFLFWGRMAEQKGVASLLHAFKRVLENKREASLILVGEGECKATYEKLAKTLGVQDRVQFAGWKDVDTIRQLASESAAGVFPSTVESFGLAVAEALATEIPVVATRVGALPEIIEECKTGFLVDSGDVEGLAKHMTALLNDPNQHRKMAARGRLKILENCSWEKSAGEALETYQQLIKETRPSP